MPYHNILNSSVYSYLYLFLHYRLYDRLLKVAEMGHAKAMEKVAYAMLFGDYLPQSIPQAKEIFEKLALEGSPKAQTVIATVY